MAEITFPKKITMTPLRMLQQARSLIARGWAQNTMAKDINGVQVHPASTVACSWCMSGALHRVADSDRECGPHFNDAWSALEDAVGEWPSFTSWNDKPGRTRDEVLEAFDKAIKAMTPAAGPAATTKETKHV